MPQTTNPEPRGYSTATFARKLELKPQSLRTALWRDGHYCGIRPIKLGDSTSSRLLWPADQVDALLSRGAQ
jgi:hypothetical protein